MIKRTSRMKTNKLMDEIRETMTPEMKMQMELSVSIANRIYEILEEKGMSQKDFALLMGKTETEVSRWLSGTHNMTVSTIAKISTALGEDIIAPVRPVPPPRRRHVAAVL
jgi:ribosome-binding protein aMBF1 (putative translation factor)